EDGIRDKLVTGVQTYALPISHTASSVGTSLFSPSAASGRGKSIVKVAPRPGPSLSARIEPPISAMALAAECRPKPLPWRLVVNQIGRASCRERVVLAVVGVML